MTYFDGGYDTQVLGIDDYSLELAKKYILNEELVGFPTETVYGLGAMAYSDAYMFHHFVIAHKANSLTR
mgnify:CR=1 FL=1